MSYATGSATNSTDLVKKLVTFLVAAGWTTDSSVAEGLGWRAHLHKSGNYVHLRAAENEQPWQAGSSNNYSVNLYLGTGFIGGQPWNNQTTGAPIQSGGSAPVGVGIPTSIGPFANYHFFSDSAGDNIVAVLEQTTGLFKHMGWGLSLNKAGAYTGGAYFFGTSSGYYVGSVGASGRPGFDITASCPGTDYDAFGAVCTFVRADVDSFTGKWISIGDDTSSQEGYTGKTGSSSVTPHVHGTSMRGEIPVYAYNVSSYEFQFLQTSLQDGRANLLPLLVWVVRDGGSTGRSLLGDIPNVFSTNAVGNGFSQASDYPLGGDTYKLFPYFAVKKVP
jgi:hypothetical protein